MWISHGCHVAASYVGFGLRCHRAVGAVCELVGIEDLRAKVIGSTNLLNVVQATFKALQSQVSIANK